MKIRKQSVMPSMPSIADKPMSMPTKRRMKAFKIDEISFVDKPAQEGALATISKRRTTKGTTDMGKVGQDRLIKMVLLNGTENFVEDASKVIGKADGWIEKANPYVSALDLSLRSILSDDTLTDDNRLMMMRKSAADFLQVAEAKLPGIGNYIQKSADPDERSADQMNLRQLKKKMDVLNTKLDAVIAKRSQDNEEDYDDDFVKSDEDDDGDAELFKADDEEEAALAERLRQLFGKAEKKKPMMNMDDIRAEITEDNADELDDEEPDEDEDDMGKKMETKEGEGLTTTEGEEDEPIAAGAKKPIGKRQRIRLHETIVVGDRVFHKMDIGQDMFDVIKAQQVETDRISKALEDERDTRELLEYAKVADEELPHLPGRTEDKARLLKSLASHLDADERKLLTAMLKSGDRSAGTAFKTFGSKAEKSHAAGDFQKRISVIKSRDACSYTEAARKARQEHPDEFEAYQNGGGA